MTFEELIKKVTGDTLITVTALAYDGETNVYHSFRTVYDRKTAKHIRDVESGWLATIYDAEVKSISIRGDTLWVDVIEYICQKAF